MGLLQKGKLVIGLESIGSRRKFIILEEKGKTDGMKEELGVGDDVEVGDVSFAWNLERRAFTYHLRRNDYLDIQHVLHNSQESLEYHTVCHRLSLVKQFKNMALRR